MNYEFCEGHRLKKQTLFHILIGTHQSGDRLKKIDKRGEKIVKKSVFAKGLCFSVPTLQRPA